MNYTDEEIVKMVLAGKKELFGMLVDRYQLPIYNLMLRCAGSGEDAADLTQDAFVRAFDRLPKFHGDRRFFSWLYSLALNLLRDRQRKKTTRRAKHHLLEQEALDYGKEVSQDFGPEDREDLHLLEKALFHLPSHTREILIFRYRHGCSIKEVAKAFNISDYLESGSYQTALQYYQQALKNDPSHPEALYNSALAYQMLNDVEQEKRAFSSYLEFYRSGKWAQRAVKHLHRLGDFSFRSYKIGGRRFVFNMEALLDTHSSRHGREVDLLARTVNNTKGQGLHIVFYNHDHKAEARTAALSLRQQLLRQLDPQTTPPLRISWFEATETVALMSGQKKQLSPSLLIFTHSLDTNNGRNST